MTIIPIIALITVFLYGCSKGNYLGPESAEFLATASQEDCGYIQNEFGQRVSWKTHVPIIFTVSRSIPAELHQDIVLAAEDWNKAAGKELFKIILDQLDSSDYNSQDLKNTITGWTQWDNTKSTQQAVTVVKYRGNLIIEADIKVNLKNFVYYSQEAKNSTDVHFGSLLVHELGHGIGLKHGMIRPTVMWSTLSSLLVRLKLSETDLKSLECEY